MFVPLAPWELKVLMIVPNVYLALQDTNAVIQVKENNNAHQVIIQFKELTLPVLLVLQAPIVPLFTILLLTVLLEAILDIEPLIVQHVQLDLNV